MTWISLVCLLAISSAALGRSVSDYGSYGSAPQATVTTVFRDTLPKVSYGGYSAPKQQEQGEIQITTAHNNEYGSYGSSSMTPKLNIQGDFNFGRVQERSFASPQQLLMEQQQRLQQKIAENTIVTEADNLCRGQAPETVIPLDGGRRYVTCIEEGKGHEQWCPQGLLYRPDTRRCERKPNLAENACSAQPCLNGGQCLQSDLYQYTCQCAPGFDGKNCELDATVCQTQQPCGSSFDVKCQSFRPNAALTHVCIFQGGRAYGLTSSQTIPNPCNGVDATLPLSFSDKGFIMCDSDAMFVESCPGGTVWDVNNKACVWPDLQGLITIDVNANTRFPSSGLKVNTLSQQRDMSSQFSGYGYGKTPSIDVQIIKEKLPQPQQYGGYGAQQVQLDTHVEEVRQPQNYGYSAPRPQIKADLVVRQPQSYGYSAPQPMIKTDVFVQPPRQPEPPRQNYGY